ncbi:MAG: DUF475 domain-containing protein [Prochlorococcus sp.]
MDSAALPLFTSWLDGVDQWSELAPLLPVLVAIELILSADNAIALAAISRSEGNPELERRSLNVGIALALVLRIGLILMASWVLQFWQLKVAGGCYLLWLFISHLREQHQHQLDENNAEPSASTPQRSFLKTVLLLAFTDLAFSIDSVAAAVAISDQLLLVITGALIGVLALRFTSELFIRWLMIFPRLEMAGYLAVAIVGVKLLLMVVIPGLEVPAWLTLVMIIPLFFWGFSSRSSDSFSPSAE